MFSLPRTLLFVVAAFSIASSPRVTAQASLHSHASNGLLGVVREATRPYRTLQAALDEGYASTGSCVSGPQEGAMGVHYANGDLVGDGLLDASHPEILMYEKRNGASRLLGVEFLVIAEQWHSHTAAPPVLMGQHFHYVGSPNRYGLPPFYELHVWAWRENPHGAFVDWNPTVSCEGYGGPGSR